MEVCQKQTTDQFLLRPQPDFRSVAASGLKAETPQLLSTNVTKQGLTVQM